MRALLLALALSQDAPVADGVACPVEAPECGAVVEVAYEEGAIDAWPWWRDCAGILHYHDHSWHTISYRCTSCGWTWRVATRAPACACGWPGDPHVPECP